MAVFACCGQRRLRDGRKSNGLDMANCAICVCLVGVGRARAGIALHRLELDLNKRAVVRKE